MAPLGLCKTAPPVDRCKSQKVMCCCWMAIGLLPCQLSSGDQRATEKNQPCNSQLQPSLLRIYPPINRSSPAQSVHTHTHPPQQFRTCSNALCAVSSTPMSALHALHSKPFAALRRSRRTGAPSSARVRCVRTMATLKAYVKGLPKENKLGDCKCQTTAFIASARPHALHGKFECSRTAVLKHAATQQHR